MALLFLDSFDHYATADITTKWTATSTGGSGATLTIGASNGRRGGGGLRVSYSGSGGLTNYASKTLVTSGATFVVGFAFRTDVAPSVSDVGTGLCTVFDGATAQLTLQLRNDLKLEVRRGTQSGTSLLVSSAAAFSLNAYVYIEFKGTIDPSAGSVDVHVNGASVVSGSGLNTRNSAASQWSVVQIGIPASSTNAGNSGNGLDYDDLYVCDGSGSAPWNTFLGDVRIDVRNPTAAGATTGWTPSTGSNWQNVDDATPNGDTDYNSTTTIPSTDTFTVQDAPVVGAAIYGIQHCISMKKSDAGTCTIAPVVRHSGADYVAADISPGTSYAYGLLCQQTNPGTGAAWTEAGFNAAEFGYKRTA